jgi:sec-independent protein translocase protein TatA
MLTNFLLSVPLYRNAFFIGNKTLLSLAAVAYFQYLCNNSSIKLHFMGPLGFNEILIILIIVLLLFGGKKIPELMRGLGRGMREFNDAKNNVRKEIEEGVSEKEQKSTSTQS